MTQHVFRITKAKFRDQVFDGSGGLHAEGRWARQGRPVVYAAASISLAVLEYTVHYKRRGWVPRSVLGHAEIPHQVPIQTIRVSDLPAGWAESDSAFDPRRFGEAWLDEGVSAVLCVPSAIVPQENNFLLNPMHPAFQKIVVRETVDFHFDRRLVRAAKRLR